MNPFYQLAIGLNKRWYQRLLLLFFGLLLGSGAARASHLVGADLTYVCLGNNQYQVTLTLYRDCGGIAAPTNALVNISSQSCGLTVPAVTLLQVPGQSGIEVSQLCPAALPLSECNGSNLYPGIRVHVYTAVVTLPQGCSDWVISYSLCCRNPDITNLVNPDFEDLYVQTTINNANGLCNNSPEFTTRPIPYICAGQPFNFNHGVVEPDGDSLVYTLITPMTFGAAPIAHVGGLNAAYPLNTTPANNFGFNTSTGQMTFTPANGQAQTAVVTILVSEYRNGVLIGTIMRDMQVVVLTNCTNTTTNVSAPPITIAGGSYDSLTRTFVICAGDTLLFSITVNDPNATDSVSVDNFNTNLAQVFGAGNYALLPTYPNLPAKNVMTLFVVVYTNPASLGLNSFSIGFSDNACPVPSTPVLGFNLVVPGVSVTAGDTAICAGIAQNIPLFAQTFSQVGGAATGTFQWSQISGVPAPLSSTTVQNPVAQIPGNTVPGDSVVYSVTFVTTPDPVTGTQCTTTDRVVIRFVNLPLNVQIQTPDTTLCPNGQPIAVPMTTSVSGPGVNLTGGVYNWTANPAGYLANLSATNINSPTATVSGTQGQQFTYTVSYTYGVCTGSDSQTFLFNQAQIAMPNDTTICAGATAVLGVNYTSLAAATAGLCGPSNAPCHTAPITVTAGTPTGTSVFPFRGFWEDGRVQMLYRASELTAAGVTPGLLRSVAFEVTNKVSTIPYTGFTIRIGCTAQQQFNLNQAFIPGLTQVFTGNITTTVGWNTFNLQQFYEWDGVSSLIVEVCFNNAAWTNDDPVRSQTTAFNSTLEFETDGVTGCVAASERSGTNRPVIRFSNCQLAPPYTYSWTPNSGFQVPGGTTQQNPVVAPPQTTTYTVQASDGECVLTGSMTVNVLTNLPAPTISCGTVANNATQVAFNWGGVPGATGWEYSLDTGNTWTPVPLATTSLTLSNLLNGSCVLIYVRAVGGAGPCLNNASASFVCCTSPCATTSTTLAFGDPCFGINDGSIQFSASGGSLGAPYQYTLYTSTGAVVGTLTQGAAGGSVTFGNLPPGSYYAFAIDAFGCLGLSDTISLVEPAPFVAVLDTVTMTLCYNTTDGTATVSASGGVGPYVYSWNAAAGNQTTATATGLGIGFYQMTATDANGCQQVVSNIPIVSPYLQAPVLQITTTDATGCPGDGTATIIAVQNLTGNANPGQANSIVYAWDNGQTNTLTATNLSAGQHTVTATDVNGCQGVATFQIGGTIAYISNATTNPPGCGMSNGSVSVTGGGTGPFTYQWSTGATGSTLDNLPGGIYTVTVTAANGCTTTGTYYLPYGTVGVQVLAQNEILSCYGDSTGSVDIGVNAPAGSALSYLWSNGETTQDLGNLPAGTYTVTVTAQVAGLTCEATQTITIQQPAAPLSAAINISQLPNCDNPNGAQLGIAPSGGWGGYSVLWSTGATTADVGNLPGGAYSVILTDAQGCKDTAVVVVPGVTLPSILPWILSQGQDTAFVTQGTTGIALDAGINPSQINQAIFNWAPPTNIANPLTFATTVDAPDAGTFTYTVEVRIDNCVATGTVVLVVVPTGMRGMPTAFTPNGDGSNDVFRPVDAMNVTVFGFQVFNRFGQKVYDGEGNDNQGWDGTLGGQPQPRDVYVYVFEYQLQGSTERVVMRGEVTLVR